MLKGEKTKKYFTAKTFRGAFTIFPEIYFPVDSFIYLSKKKFDNNFVYTFLTLLFCFFSLQVSKTKIHKIRQQILLFYGRRKSIS